MSQIKGEVGAGVGSQTLVLNFRENMPPLQISEGGFQLFVHP